MRQGFWLAQHLSCATPWRLVRQCGKLRECVRLAGRAAPVLPFMHRHLYCSGSSGLPSERMGLIVWDRVMTHLDELALICRQHLDLRLLLAEEYYYGHLACCVLDAVHSMGVRYESARQVPSRYCATYGLNRLRDNTAALPAIGAQEPLSALVARIEDLGVECFASQVVRNRQRTSAVNGILKVDAVHRVARCLLHAGIETFQDLARAGSEPALEDAIRKIPGQGSGISWRYFCMLAGDDQQVKPDRHIMGFFAVFTQVAWSTEQAVDLVRQLCEHDVLQDCHLTPRSLDYAIWHWQRAQGRASGGMCQAAAAAH